VVILCTKSDLVDKSIITADNHPPFVYSMKTNSIWNYCSSKLNEGVIDIMETTISLALSRRIGEVTQNNLTLNKPPPKESQIVIRGLFSPVRCSKCMNGLNYEEHVNHCFASECLKLQEYLCDSCASSHEHPTYTEKLDRIRVMDIQGSSVRNTLHRVFNYFSNRPVFGWSGRKFRESPHGEQFVVSHQNQFQWITYQEFYKRALFVGRAFMNFVKQGDFVGVCGNNRLEWFLADIGLILHDVRSIPVHTTYDEVSLSHVMDNAQLVALVCEKSLIRHSLQARNRLESPSLKYIICMDDLSESELSDYHSEFPEICFMTLYQVELQGKSLDSFEIVEPTSKPEERVFIIEYTSGSTGKPKGVVITEKAFNHKLIPTRAFKDIDLTPSYEPLAHSSHANNISHICSGSPVVLFEEPMSDLFFQDMYVLTPVFLITFQCLPNNFFAGK
jgi:hypothetical protein